MSGTAADAVADIGLRIIKELEAERDALKNRLQRVENLARAPLIGGEGRYMQRLVAIRVELGVMPE